MRVGWVLVAFVLVGAIGSQVVGDPTAIGHAYTFQWRFGYPRDFLLCDGLMPASASNPNLRDRFDSHWTTRLDSHGSIYR